MQPPGIDTYDELLSEAITRHSREEFPDDPTQPDRWWAE